MAAFRDIGGQDRLVKYLQQSIARGHVAHAYLIDGERGTDKNAVAEAFAQTLQCEEKGKDSCGRCHSCKMAAGHNHPDIVTLTHEKPNSISVDEIREQVVGDIRIKPYSSLRKIYILPDSHLMTVQAQNALLKTLEEPPAYAVLILLTDNRDMLLPTLISRSVCLRLKGDAALLLKESPEIQEMKEAFFDVFARLPQMTVSEAKSAAEGAAAFKEQRNDYLDLALLWYRDMLLLKAGGSPDKLIFREKESVIREGAGHYGFSDIGRLIKGVQETRKRLNANVNAELSLELLFLDAAR